MTVDRRRLRRRRSDRRHGLRGLRDRVAALDGALTVDSPTDRGTRIVAEIPLEARPELARSSL